MGRTATGVKGITLDPGDEVIGMEVLEENSEILTVTEHGYGKRTREEEYRIQGRGGKGIKTCNITEKNGPLVAMKVVTGEEDLMVITTKGVLIRIAVSDISVMGRNTQGVKLIRLSDDEYVSTVAKVEKEDANEDETEILEGSETEPEKNTEIREE